MNRESVQAIGQAYYQAVFDTDRDLAFQIIRQALADGVTPETIVFEIVVPSIDRMVAGFTDTFDSSIAQHFMATQIAAAVTEEMLALFQHQPEVVGTVILGASAGDFHGLGKRIVARFDHTLNRFESGSHQHLPDVAADSQTSQIRNPIRAPVMVPGRRTSPGQTRIPPGIACIARQIQQRRLRDDAVICRRISVAVVAPRIKPIELCRCLAMFSVFRWPPSKLCNNPLFCKQYILMSRNIILQP